MVPFFRYLFYFFLAFIVINILLALFSLFTGARFIRRPPTPRSNAKLNPHQPFAEDEEDIEDADFKEEQ